MGLQNIGGIMSNRIGRMARLRDALFKIRREEPDEAQVQILCAILNASSAKEQSAKEKGVGDEAMVSGVYRSGSSKRN
jgi:hypothetical protein